MQDDGRGGAAKPEGERWGLQDVANDADCLLRGLDAALMRSRQGRPGDERLAAIIALDALLHFISAAVQRTSGPKQVRTTAAHGFVRSLAHALVELNQGIVAPVFEPVRKWDKLPLRAGIREARANAAAAMHGLVRAGFPAVVAAQFVAEEIEGRPELRARHKISASTIKCILLISLTNQ